MKFTKLPQPTPAGQICTALLVPASLDNSGAVRAYLVACARHCTLDCLLSCPVNDDLDSSLSISQFQSHIMKYIFSQE